MELLCLDLSNIVVDDLVRHDLDLTDIVVDDIVCHDLTNNVTIIVGDLVGLRLLHINVLKMFSHADVLLITTCSVDCRFIQVEFLFLIDPDTHALTIVLVVVGVVIIRDRAIEVLPTLFALRGGGELLKVWRGRVFLKP